MKSYEVYSALHVRHKIVSGITIHMYHDTYVEYSKIGDSLGHGSSHKMRTMTYEEMKKILHKTFDKLLGGEIAIGTCGNCKYAEPYADEWISCSKICTTFPKTHFCGYYESVT